MVHHGELRVHGGSYRAGLYRQGVDRFESTSPADVDLEHRSYEQIEEEAILYHRPAASKMMRHILCRIVLYRAVELVIGRRF